MNKLHDERRHLRWNTIFYEEFNYTNIREYFDLTWGAVIFNDLSYLQLYEFFARNTEEVIYLYSLRWLVVMNIILFWFFVRHTFISFKYFLLEYIHVEATISFSEKLKVSVHIARQYPQLVSAISGFRSTAYLSTLAMICVHQHSMKSQLLIWIRCILA